MNEEPVQDPGREPAVEDVEQSTEKASSGVENTSDAGLEPLSPSDSVVAEDVQKSDFVETNPIDPKEEDKASGGEPSIDWFEPLEDDDDDCRNDPEEESLAGESERSESVAGSDKVHKKVYQLSVPRRKRSHPDEGWEEWPALGDGWKRKEVVRRSGSSMGQKDVYYLSPRGDRLRSRVELASLLEGVTDLTNFEYKTGKFYNGVAPLKGIRSRGKKKVRERSSSESSWMERGEGADTPESHHRLTPLQGLRTPQPNQTQSTMGTMNHSEKALHEDRIKLPLPSSSRAIPLPSINGEIGTEDSTLVCARCGISFTGTWYDKQRKRPSCPTCWASKSKVHPMIRFRKDCPIGVRRVMKERERARWQSEGQASYSLCMQSPTGAENQWIPCGQCVGCHNTQNCGQCANCKNGLHSPESRKRICWKRRCLCPIRKGSGGGGGFQPQRPQNDIPDTFDDSMSFQSEEITDSQHPSLKSSDTENFAMNVDVEDEDDMSTDDDDDWHKKRKRRSCGECKACLCRKDCGTCDFCVDKPKFGGSNKKRQKCRLRQCQRQAMRHLLPFQMGQGDYGADNPLLPGRPRPHYTYSRKSGLKKNKGPQLSMDFTDNEDDDSNLQAMSWSSEPAGGSKHAYATDMRNHQSPMQLNHSDFGVRNGLPDRVPHISNHKNLHLDHLSRWDGDRGRDGQRPVDEEDEEDEEEELPMITNIFSLADSPAVSGADVEIHLMKLLKSLRSSALPILWYAIMVEGPQLQLIQCAKQSHMADTIVLIDPGFCYQVTVQKQPLLPTHPLYDDYPARLTSVTEVVNLLLGLEKYVVCQGLPPKEPLSDKDPITLERASTCDFLVKKNISICFNCRVLRG